MDGRSEANGGKGRTADYATRENLPPLLRLMNALELYCAETETGADPSVVLTWLTVGIPDPPVSDLCQTIAGVDSGDAERAVARILKAKRQPNKPTAPGPTGE